MIYKKGEISNNYVTQLAILNSLSPIEESLVYRISLGRECIIIISNYYSDRTNLTSSADITLRFSCCDINDRKQNYTNVSKLICYNLPPLQRPSLARKLVTRYNTCNCLRGCLHSIISSHIIRARTNEGTNAWYFRASIYQSLLDRSVERITWIYILMFINCPRGQRNYFVNHRRGKMMLATVRQLSSRYSCSKLARGSGGGPPHRRSLFSHGLLEGSRGSYPSNTISLHCFVSPASRLDRLRFLPFVPRERRYTDLVL